MTSGMNSRQPSRPDKPPWVYLAGLAGCAVLILKPQVVGAPLSAVSTWFGYKAAEHIQDDMEERGFLPTTTSTTTTSP